MLEVLCSRVLMQVYNDVWDRRVSAAVARERRLRRTWLEMCLVCRKRLPNRHCCCCCAPVSAAVGWGVVRARQEEAGRWVKWRDVAECLSLSAAVQGYAACVCRMCGAARALWAATTTTTAAAVQSASGRAERGGAAWLDRQTNVVNDGASRLLFPSGPCVSASSTAATLYFPIQNSRNTASNTSSAPIAPPTFPISCDAYRSSSAASTTSSAAVSSVSLPWAS